MDSNDSEKWTDSKQGNLMTQSNELRTQNQRKQLSELTRNHKQSTNPELGKEQTFKNSKLHNSLQTKLNSKPRTSSATRSKANNQPFKRQTKRKNKQFLYFKLNIQHGDMIVCLQN